MWVHCGRQADLIPAKTGRARLGQEQAFHFNFYYRTAGAQGNPKKIRDWDTLSAMTWKVDHPNPKTSGGRALNYLGSLGLCAVEAGNDGDEQGTAL